MGNVSSMFTADFETTSIENLERDGYVRVWLWSMVGIEHNEHYYGTDIKSFMDTIKRKRPRRIFFHNLKFDGKFIVDYLMRNNYEYGKYYETIIDGLGAWYEIKIHIDKKHTVKIWDSLKKFPGTSVKMLGKLVGLPKLDAPFFDRYYPEDYKPTQQEIDYCIRDSEVICEALKFDFEQGFTAMTLATDCFKFGRDKCLGGRFYRDVFPLLGEKIDTFCRKALRGGITYLKPEYEDIEVHDVKVFDVNSLYPWVMHDCPLPIGYGTYEEEKPKDKLYFVHFKSEFAIKQNKFPFIQLKNNFNFKENEFVEYSDGVQDMYLTSVDYDNFKKNYHVIDEFDHEYMSFNSCVGLMRGHIDYWMERKKYYEEQGLPFMRYIAKTMMNGFYGKTSIRTKRMNVIPEFNYDNNCISYGNRVQTEIDPLYVPYGAFVTAWARDKLINTALKVWDDFIYCDTDSIHCFCRDDYPIEIHNTDLGKWKDETRNIENKGIKTGCYPYGRYIKQKTYCHAVDTPILPTKLNMETKYFKEVAEIRAAGLNVDSRDGIPIDSFKYGLRIKNANFKMCTVPGGAILKPCDWTLENYEEETIYDLLKDLESDEDE